ncbi:hypothetical protein QS306_05205 [Paraburkholderia bonniea]|uniref:hypothetical protein n=1 Tax=Paraburkholderia bonniea TaxID=2152891 RepID=UPI0012921446|nr:hypothetical protein [Paraburkholderia bonniea]WJF91051.1 hypothetical protein QS306_05205 [Paraburkholderia bonniea]WJF94365.1 hypothetical protein QS308_05210 [Paraburkholderia bonniea]
MSRKIQNNRHPKASPKKTPQSNETSIGGKSCSISTPDTNKSNNSQAPSTYIKGKSPQQIDAASSITPPSWKKLTESLLATPEKNAKENSAKINKFKTEIETFNSIKALHENPPHSNFIKQKNIEEINQDLALQFKKNPFIFLNTIGFLDIKLESNNPQPVTYDYNKIFSFIEIYALNICQAFSHHPGPISLNIKEIRRLIFEKSGISEISSAKTGEQNLPKMDMETAKNIAAQLIKENVEIFQKYLPYFETINTLWAFLNGPSLSATNEAGNFSDYRYPLQAFDGSPLYIKLDADIINSDLPRLLDPATTNQERQKFYLDRFFYKKSEESPNNHSVLSKIKFNKNDFMGIVNGFPLKQDEKSYRSPYACLLPVTGPGTENLSNVAEPYTVIDGNGILSRIRPVPDAKENPPAANAALRYHAVIDGNGIISKINLDPNAKENPPAANVEIRYQPVTLVESGAKLLLPCLYAIKHIAPGFELHLAKK